MDLFNMIKRLFSEQDFQNWINQSYSLTDLDKKILHIIKHSKGVSTKSIADQLNLKKSDISFNIFNLENNNYIHLIFNYYHIKNK